MKNLVTDDMKAHMRSGVTSLCTCVNIIRQDGKSFYFTDHDRPVLFDNSIFRPNFGFARTSVQTTLQLEVDSLEVKGIMLGSNASAGSLISLAITREDIDNGLYDFARVFVFLVNWADPTMGKIPIRRGWLGEVESNEDGTYKAEVRGLSQVLAYRIGEAFSPECRADLGDSRCKIALNPDLWQANTGYQRGDKVVGIIDPANDFINLPINNPSFESTLIVNPGTAVPDWITYGDKNSRWQQASSWAPTGVTGAVDGSFFIAFVNQTATTSTTAGMYQDVNLVSAGFTTDQLDTGLCRLSGVANACSTSDEAHYRIRVSALSESGDTVASLFDSGERHTAQNKFVANTFQDLVIPATTRSIRFDLWTNKKSSDGVGSLFDLVRAAVNLPDGTFQSAQQYGGVAFLCTQAGITGATAPDWSNEIGATFTDGTAAWVCVNSPKRIGAVSTVESDGKSFTSTDLIDAVGYFDDGVLTWETGPNAGRSIEVTTWASGILNIIFKPLYPISVGDRFVVFPGCDKLRSTCVTKFANIDNFRGEPDVPGQDVFTTTPNAPS